MAMAMATSMTSSSLRVATPPRASRAHHHHHQQQHHHHHRAVASCATRGGNATTSSAAPSLVLSTRSLTARSAMSGGASAAILAYKSRVLAVTSSRGRSLQVR